MTKLLKPHEIEAVSIGTSSKNDVRISGQKRCSVYVDTFLEGVHFDLVNMTPNEVAQRCAAISLTQASVTGDSIVRSVARVHLPDHTSAAILDGYAEGFQKFSRGRKLPVTHLLPALSPQTTFLSLQTYTISSKAKKRKAIPKKGDMIFVTSPIGSAAAGLEGLRKEGRTICSRFPNLAAAYLTPQDRSALAEKLHTIGIGNMVAMRDGLVTELHRLLPDGLGITLEQEHLPIAPDLARAAELYRGSLELWTLYGAEDFSLLVTIPPALVERAKHTAKTLRQSLHKIGEISRSRGVKLIHKDGATRELAPRMWHMLARRRT